MIITRLIKDIIGDKKIAKPVFYIARAISWIITFFFVNITWVFFRAESIGNALFVLKKAFTFNSGAAGLVVDPIIHGAFKTPELAEFMALTNIDTKFPNLLTWGFLLVSFIIAIFLPNSKKMFDKFKPSVITLIFTILFFVWSFLSISGVSTFLYFIF